MKKFLSFFIMSFLLFSFCSCGLTVTETDNETSRATSTVSDFTETSTEQKTETTEKTSVSEQSNTSSVTEKSTNEKDEKTTKIATEKTTVKKEKQEITTAKQISCTLEISCRNILENKSDLKENKSEFLTESGVILNQVKVTVPDGSTALDVIKKACVDNVCTDNCKYCKRNGIQLDYVYTPGYDSYYIRGIHQIYEKDCGTQSGWMYCVNDVFPNYGCNQYKVSDGDVIRFMYTCDLGEDLGAGE